MSSVLLFVGNHILATYLVGGMGRRYFLLLNFHG